MTRAAVEARLNTAERDAAFRLLAPSRLILAAVSGGSDSSALMHLLAGWCGGPERPRLVVATVDHALRPESRAEAEEVGRAAAALGLPHAILTWTDRPTRASQEAARRARYRLLAGHAAEIEADTLVTAHTLEDQAETLLIRLAAGSGLTGLAGMRAVSRRAGIRHVRPFLTVPKARLVATCRAEGWSFIEDPSNANPAFARARWRRAMPALAAEGLDASRLAKLAERLARADEALDRAAREAFADLRIATAGDVLTFDKGRLAELPEEVALRVLIRALSEAGPPDEDAAVPLRLERLEACLADILAAHEGRRPLRRTIAGRLLTLTPEGALVVAPEPPRRRGRRAALTEIVAAPAASLGTGEGDA